MCLSQWRPKLAVFCIALAWHVISGGGRLATRIAGVLGVPRDGREVFRDLPCIDVQGAPQLGASAVLRVGFSDTRSMIQAGLASIHRLGVEHRLRA